MRTSWTRKAFLMKMMRMMSMQKIEMLHSSHWSWMELQERLTSSLSIEEDSQYGSLWMRVLYSWPTLHSSLIDLLMVLFGMLMMSVEPPLPLPPPPLLLLTSLIAFHEPLQPIQSTRMTKLILMSMSMDSNCAGCRYCPGWSHPSYRRQCL